ncbi:MAG: hypothetical protein NTW21_02655 [Verrucomicrobia bacterium]|nr:hypothetical protein [Verrucomicrobiota bacterium]
MVITVLFSWTVTPASFLALHAAEATYPSDAIVSPDKLAGRRTTISLNGRWQVDESVSATEVPKVFGHTIVVPGLVSLAKPEFPEVGTVSAKRNYCWYQKSFAAPTSREAAILRIGKSQFGTAVWLNGKPLGEHLSCWTAGYFNLTEAMNWSGENRLVVRIGAYPALLPANIPGAGIAGSSKYWIPGIWDDVGLILCDNPVIETIQVAPRVNASEAVVQTKVKNYGPARSFELSHVVKSWKAGTEVARGEPQKGRIEAGEERTFTQTIRIPNTHLWSPDIYDKALPGGKAGERQEYRWYMTAALTEFWRFQRCAIGVLYYDFMGSYPLGRPGPGPYHFGAFSDIVSLQLQPEFEKYMTEAFKPLGVYIKFWGDGEPGKQPYVPYGQWFPVQGGANHDFAVGLINDDLEPIMGKLVLSVENLEGKTIASTEKPFRLDGVGRNTYELAVSVPKDNGKYLLKAVAYPQGTRHKSPTVSLRKVVVDSP